MANAILHAKFQIDIFIFKGSTRTKKFNTLIEAKTGILDPQKHSQYKNNATQLKNFLGLKLLPFFLQRVGDRKRRQFQNQEVFQLNCVVLILTAL